MPAIHQGTARGGVTACRASAPSSSAVELDHLASLVVIQAGIQVVDFLAARKA